MPAPTPTPPTVRRAAVFAAVIAASAGPAFAQTSVAPPPTHQPSTVQLYGVLDAGAYSKQLADTGDSGRNGADPFFGRHADVGLSSPTWGAVRMGRISTATFLSEIFFGAFLDSTTLGPTCCTPSSARRPSR